MNSNGKNNDNRRGQGKPLAKNNNNSKGYDSRAVINNSHEREITHTTHS
jgi:hypothetical protein